MVAAVVSAVVGTLVGVALNPVTNNVMALVFKLVEKEVELWVGFKKDMAGLKRGLGMLAAASEDQLSGRTDPSTVRRICMEGMQELSYDIQDCMDRILRYSVCGGSAYGRRNFAKEIEDLVGRLKDARDQQKSSSVNDTQPLTPKEETGTSNVELVGIDEPKDELRKVLDGHPEELSVISIVGFSGLGKTALARKVYDCYDGADKFQCQAWVVASDHQDDTSLLKALQEALIKKDPQSSNVQSNITRFLKNKRYLIVLDDIKEQQWDRLKSIFPVEKKSRIIVTTTIQGVAKLCSKHSSNGYVYNMRPLGKGNSKELLKAILRDNLPAGFDQNSHLIVEKFDGHPLSLVSVAKYLLKKDEFPENFWNELGDCMRKECAFTELQRVLIKHFSNLQGHGINLKILLLCICVFPNTHPIRRSRLIRRWLVQGYLKEDPDKNLEKLIDLNIIRSIDPGKDAKPKTCRAHGIMHEFLLDIARSINFVTDLGNPARSNCRHLFLEGRRPSIVGASTTSCKSVDEKEEPRAHSLTICGGAGEAVGYFPKCELLRVLDLEECNELEDQHTVDIHKLWHLKYLSLGAKIKKVPRCIEKLHCLETLDMRKTMEEIELPLEVIKLPHLTHLLGKFKLGKRNWENMELKALLPTRSNLQMLTGFITDDNPGFPMLMVHMMELSKVKIWCKSVGNTSSLCFASLLTAIKLFVQSRLDTACGEHSLSLYLNNSAEDILTSLHNSINTDDGGHGAYLSSLKLQGNLRGLTQIIACVAGLKELCLWSTNNLEVDELSNLSELKCLRYLKLVKVSLGAFVIRCGDFKALRRLCLVQCPGLPQIENEALPNLLSLRIFNKDVDIPSGIEIKYLVKLQEVGLDSEVKKETKTDWENAAKEHPKRPRVLFFRRVDTDGTESTVKYVLQKEEVDEEAKPTAQECTEDIASNSQDVNSSGSDGGLRYGNSSQGSGQTADDLGTVKESNHATGDENDKADKSIADEEAKPEVVGIKEATADGSTSTGKSSVDNSNRKGKGKVDGAIVLKEGKRIVCSKSRLLGRLLGRYGYR